MEFLQDNHRNQAKRGKDHDGLQAVRIELLDPAVKEITRHLEHQEADKYRRYANQERNGNQREQEE